MRILFLCQYFPPEMGAAAARTHEHAREWAKLGHEVTVLCGLPNHPDGVIPAPYRGTALFQEQVDGINVMRCWLYTTPNRGVFRRSIAFITFMFSAVFFGATRAPACDIVVATSPQMLCGLAGYLIAKIRRKPFVLEVRDLWPKQIIDLGAVRNPLVVGFLGALERFMYRHARGVVTVAEATRQEIIGRGFPAEKIFTVTNGVDADFFRPHGAESELRAAQGWIGKIVVMYIGTHGLSHGLSTILDTAELLAPRDDIEFVFVGDGAERGKIVRQARQRGLENVAFLPAQPKESMPAYYAAADICLVPLKNLKVFLYNIPSKMFEIMACGRPIILGARGQARQLLDESGAGIAVEPEDAQAYAEAIVRLAENPELREKYGRQGREHAANQYTRAKKAADYAAILARLAERG